MRKCACLRIYASWSVLRKQYLILAAFAEALVLLLLLAPAFTIQQVGPLGQFRVCHESVLGHFGIGLEVCSRWEPSHF